MLFRSVEMEPFHVLLALADGERHGYAIMQDVAASTGGTFRMGPGTLYGTMNRLLAAELVAETGERQDSSMNEERRRDYRITPNGWQAIMAESKRLESRVRIQEIFAERSARAFPLGSKPFSRQTRRSLDRDAFRCSSQRNS